MWIFSPLAWLTIAALLGIPAWRGRARCRWLWRGCLGLIALALLGSTPLVANGLLALFERPVAGALDCRTSAPDTVVVLAGGIEQRPTDATDFSVLVATARRRLERAVTYWREGDDRNILISGGSTRAGTPAEALLMSAYAQALGVPPPAIGVELQATNTWEHARFIADLVPAVPRRIALATSALHMPRAVLAFRFAGFEVCPLPADPRFTAIEWPDALVPRSSALVKTEAALHEFVGLIYYRLRALRGAPG